MSREKQIEEMEKVIEEAFLDDYNLGCDPCTNTVAEKLYNAGYRKQSEGEWIGKTDYAGYGYYCSNCNDAVFTGENAEWIAKSHYYCPICGAKMKGGE